MIEEGQRKHRRYWGWCTVEKVAKLSEPVEVHGGGIEASFNPTLVKIKWDNKDFHHEFWFPYWIAINDSKEKYGQFAPMMGEDSLLELLKEAIGQDFFTKSFLEQLHEATAPHTNTV